eukprot:SAG31_NODE_2000_length_6694_cov_13.828658_6_plen_88_part_00
MGKKAKVSKAAAGADAATGKDIKGDTSPNKKEKDTNTVSKNTRALPDVPFLAGTNRGTTGVDTEDISHTLRTPARTLSAQDLSVTTS